MDPSSHSVLSPTGAPDRCKAVLGRILCQLSQPWILQPYRIDDSKRSIGDCGPKNLLAAKSGSYEVVLGVWTPGSVDHHELRSFGCLPKRQGNSTPTCGTCTVAPTAQNQVEMGALGLYVPRRPLNEIRGLRTGVSVHEAPYSSRRLATARARIELLGSARFYLHLVDTRRDAA